jgi:NADH dehydrogenase FAD-containing subunit
MISLPLPQLEIDKSAVSIKYVLNEKDKSLLASTHRIIIIERNSHFNYMFAFPRACVVSGFEDELFVPYDRLFEKPAETSSPTSSSSNANLNATHLEGQVVQALAVSITETHVELDRSVQLNFEDQDTDLHDTTTTTASEPANTPTTPTPTTTTTKISYDYLIYAAGGNHIEPASFAHHPHKQASITRIQHYQSQISKSTKILVIGGGAVGTELAAEIKEHYPSKQVTIVHSRESYMDKYKLSLHKRMYKILDGFGVKQVLGDRVIIPEGGFDQVDGTEENDGLKMITVETKKGLKIECDLQVIYIYYLDVFTFLPYALRKRILTFFFFLPFHIPAAHLHRSHPQQLRHENPLNQNHQPRHRFRQSQTHHANRG